MKINTNVSGCFSAEELIVAVKEVLSMRGIKDPVTEIIIDSTGSEPRLVGINFRARKTEVILPSAK